MHFGVHSYNNEYGIRPDDAARAAEERGFESAWFGEHTNIPVSRDTPFPLGGEMPEEYKHFMDIFVSMTAAAMATTRLRIGAGVCLLIERDPIVVAKSVATLDYLCAGRVIFGIGGGWNREEMANHGTEFKTRWKLLRERVEAIKALWTQESAGYSGELVNITPTWVYPKPVQKPHPPILLGAVSKAGLKRVVNYCDGWILVDPQDGSLERARIELNELCVEKGRDPATISLSVYATSALSTELLDRYAAAGADRVVSFLPADSAADALVTMDECAKFIPQYA
jgi:probable F420-dependent oxidoreductase